MHCGHHGADQPLMLMLLRGTLVAVAVASATAVSATLSRPMSMFLVRALATVAVTCASTKLAVVNVSVMLMDFRRALATVAVTSTPTVATLAHNKLSFSGSVDFCPTVRWREIPQDYLSIRRMPCSTISLANCSPYTNSILRPFIPAELMILDE